MLNWMINSSIVLLAFLSMEGVAWFTHKYIMHGFFWFLHKDHHKKDHSGFMERNDFFFLIFALPGILCLAIGTFNQIAGLTSVGIGITLYGACYFFVHDLFIHQRLKLFRNSENGYLNAIRRAHKMHHKHLGKENGECFGMLFIPFKFFKQHINNRV